MQYYFELFVIADRDRSAPNLKSDLLFKKKSLFPKISFEIANFMCFFVFLKENGNFIFRTNSFLHDKYFGLKRRMTFSVKSFSVFRNMKIRMTEDRKHYGK